VTVVVGKTEFFACDGTVVARGDLKELFVLAKLATLVGMLVDGITIESTTGEILLIVNGSTVGPNEGASKGLIEGNLEGKYEGTPYGIVDGMLVVSVVGLQEGKKVIVGKEDVDQVGYLVGRIEGVIDGPQPRRGHPKNESTEAFLRNETSGLTQFNLEQFPKERESSTTSGFRKLTIDKLLLKNEPLRIDITEEGIDIALNAVFENAFTPIVFIVVGIETYRSLVHNENVR
jgi:hypothetical protein